MTKLLILLSTSLLLLTTKANASDSCKILLNKKTLFNGTVDDTNAVIKLSSAGFKNADCITIAYATETSMKRWNRTFYVETARGQNLKTIKMDKQSGSVSFKASVLTDMQVKKQPVLLYTISLPADKAMAARIRVRPMLICKIEWL